MIDQAKPIAHPAVDAWFRAASKLLCEMATPCGREVPIEILRYVAHDDLPPEVLTYVDKGITSDPKAVVKDDGTITTIEAEAAAAMPPPDDLGGV